MTDNTQTSFDVVTEIRNAITIIDHAAEQGAFRGWEAINQVLACRGRLIAFSQMMDEALNEHNAANADTDQVPETDQVEPTIAAIPTEPVAAPEHPLPNTVVEHPLPNTVVEDPNYQPVDELTLLREQYAAAMQEVHNLRAQNEQK